VSLQTWIILCLHISLLGEEFAYVFIERFFYRMAIVTSLRMCIEQKVQHVASLRLRLLGT
jgi:hypothetical protein